MKKQLFLLLAILTNINMFAQIEFEKGYFINNSNQKIECFIKNIDWLENPIDFKYNLSEESNYETADIKYVKEFGIYGTSKYIRNRVEIDRSSNNLNSLSRTSVPIFDEEELFLKVLVEGNANLYEYVDGDLTRYFYSVENSKIKQLVYKEYLKNIDDKITDNRDVISENNYYRQQLWNELKCSYFTENRFKNINYKKKDLVVFFTEYSNCNNKKVIVIKKKEVTKDVFQLTIRPRLNNSSLSVKNTYDSSKNTDFGNKNGFGLGLEAEFILPFNNKKWSILIEPTYQNYKSEKSSNVHTPYDGILTRVIDFNSIEVPFSVRHYFFFNENSKIFVNTSLVTNFKLNSSIKYYINNISMYPIEISTRMNFAVGIGYKYNDRFSLEMRYQTKKEILGKYITWSSDYKTFSMIFGYSIF